MLSFIARVVIPVLPSKFKMQASVQIEQCTRSVAFLQDSQDQVLSQACWKQRLYCFV